MNNLKRLVLSSLLTFCCVLIYAQTEFTGTVVDANGEPIIGASVMEKGTKNSAITDINGNFKLQTKAGSTLVVSYIGYAHQEVKASPNQRIILKEDAKQLNEVVVTGYGNFKKSSFTGAASTINTSALESVPPTQTPCVHYKERCLA